MSWESFEQTCQKRKREEESQDIKGTDNGSGAGGGNFNQVMVTYKQKEAVRKIVEEHGKPLGRIMTEVGYDPTTAKNPKNLTESKGYKDELARYGLTEELITTALVSDIEAKPKKRFLELSLGAEILGMKKREEAGTKTLVVMISGESAERYKIQAERANI